jgi:hypothetical protein
VLLARDLDGTNRAVAVAPERELARKINGRDLARDKKAARRAAAQQVEVRQDVAAKTAMRRREDAQCLLDRVHLDRQRVLGGRLKCRRRSDEQRRGQRGERGRRRRRRRRFCGAAAQRRLLCERGRRRRLRRCRRRGGPSAQPKVRADRV